MILYLFVCLPANFEVFKINLALACLLSNHQNLNSKSRQNATRSLKFSPKCYFNLMLFLFHGVSTNLLPGYNLIWNQQSCCQDTIWFLNSIEIIEASCPMHALPHTLSQMAVGLSEWTRDLTTIGSKYMILSFIFCKN